MSRKSLQETMAESGVDKEKILEEKDKSVSSRQAEIFARIGISQCSGNERARRLLEFYLQSLLDSSDAVCDDDAKTVMSVFGLVSTTMHRDLCNKVLAKYISRFEAISTKTIKQPVAA